MKTLYVLTGYDDFIGQTRKPWVSIDTKMFIEELRSLGFTVHKHGFHEVINGKIKPQNQDIYYTFSHRDNLRHYIRDCLMYLQASGNRLLPPLELFLCHENKGWQELLKQKLDIHSLNYHYFSSKREMECYDLRFPMVFKTLTGSNGTGVALVHSKEDVFKQLARHETHPGIIQKLDLWRRKHLRKNKQFPGYPNYDLYQDALCYADYITQEIPFILQEFVPGLSFDYRVIVLGDKYFISKRHTKEGDFRASGTKLFDFVIPNPEPALNAAKKLFETFNSPFLSVDLGEDDAGNLHLFEYQAQHFGINIIVRGEGYFTFADGTWNFHRNDARFEQHLARSISRYLL